MSRRCSRENEGDGTRDIDLEIARGQVVSIVGPSGSGKSTLLNLIGGLDRPSSGEIRIEGEQLSKLSDDDLTRVRRDKIGFVFQFFNLLPTLNCLENVALPLHLRKWPGRRSRIARESFLNWFSSDIAWNTCRMNSRVANGSAWQSPALYLFIRRSCLADEPTGNLDTHTGQEISETDRRPAYASGLDDSDRHA